VQFRQAALGCFEACRQYPALGQQRGTFVVEAKERRRDQRVTGDGK
jgi:hypothetical protein